MAPGSEASRRGGGGGSSGGGDSQPGRQLSGAMAVLGGGRRGGRVRKMLRGRASMQGRGRRNSRRAPRTGPNAPEETVPHGSYGGYYGRRMDTVERTRLLEPAWFARRAVLDIGCNDGSVSLSFHKLESTPPARIVGVDIDPALVQRAKERLRDVGVSGVEFHVEDFAAETAGQFGAQVASFDVILLLSVTKWIHLHGGDEAIRRLFERVRDCLKPGGVLVLEPQLSSSYKRARFNKRRELAALKKEAEAASVEPPARERIAAAPIERESNTAQNETAVASSGQNRGVIEHATEPVSVTSPAQAENPVLSSALPATISEATEGNGIESAGLSLGDNASDRRSAEKSLKGEDASRNTSSAELLYDETGFVRASRINFRPERFKDYLLSEEGGFSHSHTLREVSTEKNQPFNRAILAFFRRASSAGQE